ncbi:carbon storage regulator CsrA [Clostridium sp. D2Q-14]|uniref:carbon storage regulator CsrA n=1 Tax=Anaeromonas gelatinilytica TaxID=2683194 RepID=UPI00193B0814|nr:carbon storage regulator CsrA [Anaeromonas gelatinilytica]MBS4535782.1 carbon storage regulator CsrA [Anaeromonas gelatinilytica]
MLILSRKKNESVIIGDNIEVIISDIEDGKVKIGINAPKDIDIHRKEIYEDIQKENKEAANSKEVNIDKLKDMFF